MTFLYPSVSNITSSLNSASYLKKEDQDIFFNTNVSDYWFGISNHDRVLFSIYSLDTTLLNWSFLPNETSYKTTNLTFYDDKNSPINYDYKELINSYILYKNEKLLTNPYNDVSASNLPTGEYILGYQITKLMAGEETNPLIIKEVSPSKTEIKVIPSGEYTSQYNAFCLDKFILNENSSIYLQLIKDCPCDKLYESTKAANVDAINLIKNMFFISDDGKFIEFLKNLYIDFIKYISGTATELTRIQGIKTYFNNFLISNSNNIYSFSEIEGEFIKGVNKRLDILLLNYTSKQYSSAREYLYSLFVNEFFVPVQNSLKLQYSNRFQQPLKNSLYFSNGIYIPILKSGFIIENNNLVLLLKLQTPLLDDFSVKTNCWILNTCTVPILFKCIVEKTLTKTTIKISSPNFTLNDQFVQSINSNEFFNENDLSTTYNLENDVTVSKNINELNIDYTSLNNFIVFSSAELRHNIFKNKMISLANISSSLSILDVAYSSSGYDYSHYSTEKSTLEQQETTIFNTFDGWESYLYKTGYYTYTPSSTTFSSASFVDDVDEETKRYDKYNRDSLVNNTPEHILVDPDNDDYLIFLSMIGHYFDNIYSYITALPSQTNINNSNSTSKKLIQDMLTSFGWKVEDVFDSLSISDQYLDTKLSGDTDLSTEERTRQIWTRILVTLPQIYKTKGVEECIKMILSCYGIPSTMLNIKEYGGNDESLEKTKYTVDENIFMLNFDGNTEYIRIPFDPSLQTIEFKTALNSTKKYNIHEKIPLVRKYNQYNQLDWVIGVYKEYKKYLGRVYFELGYPEYKIGVIGNYGIIDNTHFQSTLVARSIAIKNPDIILTTGNNTYLTGATAFDSTAGRLYHNFMTPYSGSFGSGSEVNRLFTTIGDSDYISGAIDPYINFFRNLPEYKRYYTFTKGNVQFFVLNSVNSLEPSGSTSSSLQADWFKSEMSSSILNNDILWRVASFSHPFTSSAVLSKLGTGALMNWPWSAWHIDLLLNGHDNFYERLEADGVPIIIQGGGGATLESFPKSNSCSKFKYNLSHGYSIITSKGNSLIIDLYDKFGVKISDTGTTSLSNCSVINGSFKMIKPQVPFSDRPFNQSDKYILSDEIPIFNEEIFNVMLRKNDPSDLFEENTNVNLIPTKFDLWTQRNEDNRIIFSSSKSDVFTQTYITEFINTGKLYFGNYSSSVKFTGLLDKILLWDNPITNNNFNDHCDNINSYCFTGSSIPHETLYFRMNYDTPKDLSLINPTIIQNHNTYYSSSIDATAYNFHSRSLSGSIDNGCTITSHSVHPYQFSEIPYTQTFSLNGYGPNKFKNEKIKKTSLNLEVRLDPNERSTENVKTFISQDSSQLGLFLDPNEYKNKDIFRYIGGEGVTTNIAGPEQMFDDKYYSLQSIREMYNRSGNKKTYYNEFFTLYKLYFDKSIFKVIKQLLPARNNVYTGILIEPTVLERPKYQYKRLSAETGDLTLTSTDFMAITSSLMVRPPSLSIYTILDNVNTLSSEVLFADFNTTTIENSQSYTEYSSKNFVSSIDLTGVNTITKQYYTIGSTEFIPDINNREELGIQCDSTGKIIETVLSGSNFRYLLRTQNKLDYSFPIGLYNKKSTVVSQSIYLYDTEILNESEFSTLVYTSSFNEVVSNATINRLKPHINEFSPGYIKTPTGWIFPHDTLTFKNTPNHTKNNKFSLFDPLYPSHSYTFILNFPKTYELTSGYSRKHLNNKKIHFSPVSFSTINGYTNISGSRYIKSRQTLKTTVNLDGLEDNTVPIQSINVSNINIVRNDNVINV